VQTKIRAESLFTGENKSPIEWTNLQNRLISFVNNVGVTFL